MKTLLDLFESTHKKYGSKPALSMRPRWRMMRWTFNDLYNYATAIASQLQSLGVGHQDKVILISPNSPMWAGSFFGGILKGAIIVPLNPQSSPDFIKKIVKKTGAKAILKSIMIKCPDIGIPVIDIEQPGLEEKPKRFKKESVKPDDIAEIVYTSGTTGDPKGVVLTHKNIITNILSVTSLFHASKNDKVVSILPLFHMYEQVACLFLAMYFGVEVMYAPSVSSRSITSTLQEMGATKMLVVPEVLESILNKIETKARDAGRIRKLNKMFKRAQRLPYFLRRLLFLRVHKLLGGKLRMIACGGAALHEDVERKWNAMGFKVYQGYGLTETSPAITMNYPGNSRIGSVGKIVPGVEVKFGENKEILARGPSVFSGYYKDKKRTDEVFDKDGYFKTGDIGHLDGDGFLYISGRAKYMIVTSSGENVYPEDIEGELNKISGVKDSAVVGVSDNNHTLIHAVILGDVKDPTSAVEQVNKRLSPHQRIQDWSIWPEDDFPRSATRKVKKGEVIEWINSQRDEATTSPTTKVSPLINLLSSISNKKVTQISDKSLLYKDLHLDSLMRIELVSRLEESMDALIEEQQITNTTTVGDLEKLISESKKETVKRPFKLWLLSWPAVMMRELIINLIIFPVYRLMIKVEVEGVKNLNKISTPVIFMSNHVSFLDGLIILRALPARFRSKVALSAALDFLYTHYWWAAWAVEFMFNSYPLPRTEKDNIRPGLEYTGKLLDRGFSVLVFPEGSVNRESGLKEFKLGAGLIANEMDAPLILMHISGIHELMDPYQLFPRCRGVVKVKVSTPLTFDGSDSYDEATSKIYDGIKKLS